MKRLTVSTLAAGVIAAVVSVVGLAATADASEQYPGCAEVYMYSHRGDQTTGFTENSKGAHDLAGDKGDGFETDLRTTSDGSIILMHDGRIDRTTTGGGVVAQMTATQIRANPLNDGSKVPLLAGALNVLVDHPAQHALLELKTDAIPPASLRKLRHAIQKRELTGRVTVTSFDRSLLLDMEAIARSSTRLCSLTRTRLAGLPVSSFGSAARTWRLNSEPGSGSTEHMRSGSD